MKAYEYQVDPIKNFECVATASSGTTITLNGSQINNLNIAIESINTSQSNIINTINTIKDTIYDTSPPHYDYDDIFKHIAEMFAEKPVIEHTCNSCGAKLKINSDKHIFHCEYCDAVYLIGTENILMQGLNNDY